jgi:hypothetical protein
VIQRTQTSHVDELESGGNIHCFREVGVEPRPITKDCAGVRSTVKPKGRESPLCDPTAKATFMRLNTFEREYVRRQKLKPLASALSLYPTFLIWWLVGDILQQFTRTTFLFLKVKAAATYNGLANSINDRVDNINLNLSPISFIYLCGGTPVRTVKSLIGQMGCH